MSSYSEDGAALLISVQWEGEMQQTQVQQEKFQ